MCLLYVDVEILERIFHSARYSGNHFATSHLFKCVMKEQQKIKSFTRFWGEIGGGGIGDARSEKWP